MNPNWAEAQGGFRAAQPPHPSAAMAGAGPTRRASDELHRSTGGWLPEVAAHGFIQLRSACPLLGAMVLLRSVWRSPAKQWAVTGQADGGVRVDAVARTRYGNV